jgi:hypothetical protein
VHYLTKRYQDIDQEPSLTPHLNAIGSPPRLVHYIASWCVCPNEALASLINSGMASLKLGLA